jgi:hypothetical protein
MSNNKSFAKSVIGWFVVPEGGENTSDNADDLIAKYANEPAQPPPVELKGPLPQMVGGKVDFDQVYDAAGVDKEERDRISKAQALLRSLPAETPVATKKQIVEASLKAFGVPTEKIIEAAVEEMQALEAFIRAGQSETQTLLADSSKQITELEASIAKAKQVMADAVQSQEARTGAVNNEKLQVQQVLEFFGQEAVAKVVRDSPKLKEPT